MADPVGHSPGGEGSTTTNTISNHETPASPRPRTSRTGREERRHKYNQENHQQSGSVERKRHNQEGGVGDKGQKRSSGSQSSSTSPSPGYRRVVIVGFDNSDRNENRKSIGSATDKVAVERRAFGPWLKPDPLRQQKLVERLAPHKIPARPDPRFDSWVNHFQYYENIGVDVKRRRSANNSPSRPQTSPQSGGGGTANGFHDNQNGYHSDGNGLYLTQYHRLLIKRPRTTRGTLRDRDGGGGGDSNNNNNHNSNSNSMNSSNSDNAFEEVPASTREAYSRGPGDRKLASSRHSHSSGFPRGAHNRGGSESDSSRSAKSYSVVSGLDRRYMGLQSVNEEDMRQIVSRLTKMTSAYNAKFAPNPHVWIDNSPGAHMVRKRENTVA
ncbi:uncharacterized protein DDB_G0283697 [Aplysia californica]|uniref:Uncharacterized protein DDB_G0283697 n=1 Tax=Aplysia californica TaxID=6500 RepID=A0ABM0JPA6_APLCA|nr:uncharacterized protein DDB_G0283697 [Aplysia californica]